MANSIKEYLADRLNGAIFVALILFAVLALSGGPGEPSISAEALAAQSVQGGSGPYHTLDAL